jgi:hypothetical protein
MTEFRKPDLSAPRFRAKTKNLLNKKLHKAFIAKYPERKDVSLNTFRDIVTSYNGALWQAAIDNRDGVELPESLGYILIAKCDKAKKDNTDYVASAKYGKKVNHANWDSDNYLAKICYTNYSLKYRFGDRELWGFSAVKQFRQTVSRDFSKKYTGYVHLTKQLKPYQLYKK